MDITSFEELASIGYEYVVERQEMCKAEYKLETYDYWFYEQETSELIFSKNNVKKLIIKYVSVGTLSLITKTWLWSWANPNSVGPTKPDMIAVRQYGEKHGFKKLITEKWPANEIDGWEMTNISAYLLKAKGAYRVPLNDDTLLSFMIFKDIRWADQNP